MEKIIKPRRIIVYWLDGISAMFVNSFNKHAPMPNTYVDEMYKKSNVKKYCYSYDGTRSVLYGLMTGQSYIETQVSRVDDPSKFTVNKFFTDNLKKLGYKTHYHTNFRGSIKSFLLKFDMIEQEKCVYDIKDSKLDKDFWGINNEKTFIMFHSFMTHDRGGKPGHAITTDEYKHFIEKESNLMEHNLKQLQYDEDKDLLLVMSDHGLTLDATHIPQKGSVSSHLKQMFNKDRLKHWNYAGQEIKSRIIFMMKHADIENKIDEGVCSLQSAFDGFLKLLGINNYLSYNAMKYNLPKMTISLSVGMFPLNPIRLLQKIVFNDRMYQFLYVTGKGKERIKWIAEPNLNKYELYDLNDDELEQNPIKIKYKNLPVMMRQYIEEYNYTRRRDINFLIEKIKSGKLTPL